jgi:hypothetical protein
LSSSSEQLVRLLGRARDEGDWELCKELARFLQALDESGNTLREALEMVDLRSPGTPGEGTGYQSFLFEGRGLKVPRPGGRRGITESIDGSSREITESAEGSSRGDSSGGSKSPDDKNGGEVDDYFGTTGGRYLSKEGGKQSVDVCGAKP